MNDKIVKNYLDRLGIKYKVHRHAAVLTCEEAEKLCGNIPGVHSKNLFLRGKKSGNYYLAILPESKRLDLKALKNKFGEEIGFASDEELKDVLNIERGTVSSLGLINDKNSRVILLLDKDIINADIVSFHPNINTETLEFSQTEFKKYISSLKNRIEEI